MHTQRILIICLSFLGIISVFLPWFSYTIFLVKYSFNGLERNGWLIISLFALCIIFSVIKDLNQSIKLGFKAGIVICSILASTIVIVDIVTLNIETDNLIGNLLKATVSIDFGVYLLIICGLSIPLVALFFKNND